MKYLILVDPKPETCGTCPFRTTGKPLFAPAPEESISNEIIEEPVNADTNLEPVIEAEIPAENLTSTEAPDLSAIAGMPEIASMAGLAGMAGMLGGCNNSDKVCMFGCTLENCPLTVVNTIIET